MGLAYWTAIAVLTIGIAMALSGMAATVQQVAGYQGWHERVVREEGATGTARDGTQQTERNGQIDQARNEGARGLNAYLKGQAESGRDSPVTARSISLTGLVTAVVGMAIALGVSCRRDALERGARHPARRPDRPERTHHNEPTRRSE